MNLLRNNDNKWKNGEFEFAQIPIFHSIEASFVPASFLFSAPGMGVIYRVQVPNCEGRSNS